MEDETQMQDDMLMEEAPQTKPLEEHKTSTSAQEINPKTSKWLWFVVVMIVVLISFGIAWFIIQENDRLSSDIESGAVPQSEKLTKKAIKGIGDTLSEAKDMIQKNGSGAEEYISTEGQIELGWHGFYIDYPYGWHVLSNFNDERSLHINPLPINLAPRGGDLSLLTFENETSLGYERYVGIEAVLEGERSNFENLVESTFKTDSDIVVYKFEGEREVFGTENVVYYYLGLPPDEEGNVSVIWSSLALIPDSDMEKNIPILERMIQSIRVESSTSNEE